MVADQRFLRVDQFGLGFGQRSRRGGDRIHWTGAWPTLRTTQEVQADGAGFRALGPNAMPDGFLGVLRHQAFEFGLGLFMFEMGRSGSGKDAGELRPGIR